MLILALALIAPMAPAAMADQGAHMGHALSAPMSHDAQAADADAADGGWLAHLACAVVCAGAPDPSAAAGLSGAPRLAPARRVWPRFAIPPGMALSPLRRPPKPSIA